MTDDGVLPVTRRLAALIGIGLVAILLPVLAVARPSTAPRAEAAASYFLGIDTIKSNC